MLHTADGRCTAPTARDGRRAFGRRALAVRFCLTLAIGVFYVLYHGGWPSAGLEAGMAYSAVTNVIDVRCALCFWPCSDGRM